MSNPNKKLTVPPGDLLFAFCAAALVALAALLARLAERYTSLGFWPAFVILLLLAALGYLTVRAVLYRRETEEKEERAQEKTTIFELVRLFRRPARLWRKRRRPRRKPASRTDRCPGRCLRRAMTFCTGFQ